MSDNIENLTLEILKSIQAELSSSRAELSAFRAETSDRLERLEVSMRKSRRNMAGMLVMMQATTGDFDQRVTEIEERVVALEKEAS